MAVGSGLTSSPVAFRWQSGGQDKVAKETAKGKRGKSKPSGESEKHEPGSGLEVGSSQGEGSSGAGRRARRWIHHMKVRIRQIRLQTLLKNDRRCIHCQLAMKSPEGLGLGAVTRTTVVTRGPRRAMVSRESRTLWRSGRWDGGRATVGGANPWGGGLGIEKGPGQIPQKRSSGHQGKGVPSIRPHPRPRNSFPSSVRTFATLQKGDMPLPSHPLESGPYRYAGGLTAVYPEQSCPGSWRQGCDGQCEGCPTRSQGGESVGVGQPTRDQGNCIKKRGGRKLRKPLKSLARETNRRACA